MNPEPEPEAAQQPPGSRQDPADPPARPSPPPWPDGRLPPPAARSADPQPRQESRHDGWPQRAGHKAELPSRRPGIPPHPHPPPCGNAGQTPAHAASPRPPHRVTARQGTEQTARGRAGGPCPARGGTEVHHPPSPGCRHRPGPSGPAREQRLPGCPTALLATKRPTARNRGGMEAGVAP